MITSSNKRVLVTGGSGLIGSKLTKELLKRGYKVSHLSRKKNQKSQKSSILTYLWDIEKGFIEEASIKNVDFIIHLAGANIGEKRWTEKRKTEIIESRVKSSQLLYKKLKNLTHSVKVVVSASAIGYYGDTGNEIITESSPSGNDFLAITCKCWEESVTKIAELGIRTAIIRTGLVLSNAGGALKKLAIPIKLYAGAPLGKGNQYYSWIHIDDLCSIYLKAIEDESIQGPYNAVSPQAVTNQKFTQVLANILNRRVILPNIPAIILKLCLGELATSLLIGSRVSSQKIMEKGFLFKYPTLEGALTELYGKRKY